MEETGDCVFEADELEALQKIAKEENKTVQELFVELMKEFLDKNIKKVEESKK